MVSRLGRTLLLCTLSGMAFNGFAKINNSCRGPYELLAVVNRPTIADSPCTAPSKTAILEGGYQYQKLWHQGRAQNFPEATVRYGLPANFEIFAYLPNYYYQTIIPHSGDGPVSLGLKHQIYSENKEMMALEGYVTPASGSRNFGNSAWEGTLNGIFSYSFNNQLSITCQLSLSTQTESRAAGGQRYNSVDIDTFLTWSLRDWIEAYGEIYGTTQTGPHQGSGFNVASGLIILVAKNMTIDVEGSQRVSGLLGNIEHYVGVGGAIQFN